MERMTFEKFCKSMENGDIYLLSQYKKSNEREYLEFSVRYREARHNLQSLQHRVAMLTVDDLVKTDAALRAMAPVRLS